ncbi:helix-turn-helix transcriptional regulator [Streptomyces sp. NA04227]|uniref:helix-turn-helix transcriptional regulator n=1 Tax=Streptomyces sp. NA04227 TaxID=2742136 RepID=UPI001592A59D|nr:LuxR C-terminal-related transcriptional regulator [Streptomyces sp. NA04227]QKW09298.1 helix-turn-helix transcriptional regulator [Streptomyces sp. NA04227]
MNLYGRAHEQWVIRQRLRTVRSGRNGLVLLDGARGSGKTTLVQRISDTAERCGFDVLSGPAERFRKLLLAASLMGGAAGSGVFTAATGPDTAWCPDLLAETLAAELAGPGREQRPGSGTRPVLIALDDVPWDDPDVRGALPALPSVASARRVLWLLSGTGAPGPHGPAQSPDTVRLSLGPLRHRDCVRMATDRLGGVPDTGLGHLVDACGGHPGLLAALLDTLSACGGHTVRGAVARAVTEPLPRLVLTALVREDPRLSAPARTLLTAVAVRSHPVRTSELTQLPDEQALPLLGAVREAVQAGVLVLDGDRLGFRHPLVREAAALLSSGPAERLDAVLQPRVPALKLAATRTTVQAVAPEVPPCDGEWPNPLSPAEHNIVRLVADGLTNRQIASRVNLSPHTVNFHLRKIFRKLGVSSRVELVGAHLHLLHPEDEPRTTPPTQESRTADAG